MKKLRPPRILQALWTLLKASPKPSGPRFKTSFRQIREEGLAPTTRDYATTEASFETQIQERGNIHFSQSCKVSGSQLREAPIIHLSGSSSASDMSSMGQEEPSLVSEEMLTTSSEVAAVFTSTGAAQGEESKHLGATLARKQPFL